MICVISQSKYKKGHMSHFLATFIDELTAHTGKQTTIRSLHIIIVNGISGCKNGFFDALLLLVMF